LPIPGAPSITTAPQPGPRISPIRSRSACRPTTPTAATHADGATLPAPWRARQVCGIPRFTHAPTGP